MNYTPSIRQKITLGYYAIVAMIIGLSVFTFLELRYIEKKIMFGEAISEFFDATLEIRRFEKNYFLYEQHSDYDENIQYVSRAQDLIDSNIAGFTSIASAEQMANVQESLKKYKNLMDQYAKIGRAIHGTKEPVCRRDPDHREKHNHHSREYLQDRAEEPSADPEQFPKHPSRLDRASLSGGYRHRPDTFANGGQTAEIA